MQFYHQVVNTGALPALTRFQFGNGFASRLHPDWRKADFKCPRTRFLEHSPPGVACCERRLGNQISKQGRPCMLARRATQLQTNNTAREVYYVAPKQPLAPPQDDRHAPGWA